MVSQFLEILHNLSVELPKVKSHRYIQYTHTHGKTCSFFRYQATGPILLQFLPIHLSFVSSLPNFLCHFKRKGEKKHPSLLQRQKHVFQNMLLPLCLIFGEITNGVVFPPDRLLTSIPLPHVLPLYIRKSHVILYCSSLPRWLPKLLLISPCQTVIFLVY